MRKADTATQAEAEALRTVIDRALGAHADSDRAGIAAAVIHEGRTIATAENEVNQANDPTRHAEIVALGKATEVLGRPDLSDCTLVSTLQPCEMCLSAMRFAGIDRVIFAARQENVAGKYFVFPGLRIEDFQAAGPAFSLVGGLYEDDVLHLYADGDE